MSESLRVRRPSPDPSSTHNGHHRPSSSTGGAIDASSRTSAGTGASVRKPATSGGACCAGTLGDLREWGERGCRRATAPEVEEDAGSHAAPAVEVDLRGWGGTREREKGVECGRTGERRRPGGGPGNGGARVCVERVFISMERD